MKQNTTIILEGGATRGVFTSGVLDFLMEKDIYIPRVIGVSAGSCNAVDYVSEQPGRTRDCMIPTDKSENYYYGIKDFVKEKSLMNMDLIFDTFPNETIPFDFDTYFKSEMKCELVVTNCRTGKAEYLDDRQDRARLMKICRASCSMPLITPMVNVDDTPYLDGGLADSVPVTYAEKSGAGKMIVILTRNKGYRKKAPSKALQSVYRRAYKSYPRLVQTILTRSFHYNKEMNHIEQLEREGKIFVLRPEVKPVARLEKNKDTLMAFYEHGYQLMEKNLDAMMKYIGE